MFFHFATRKIGLIGKVSAFFENLSFLNPGSHPNLKKSLNLDLKNTWTTLLDSNCFYMLDLALKNTRTTLVFFINNSIFDFRPKSCLAV